MTDPVGQGAGLASASWWPGDGDQEAERLTRIVQATAYAAGCSTAMFLRLRDDGKTFRIEKRFDVASDADATRFAEAVERDWFLRQDGALPATDRRPVDAERSVQLVGSVPVRSAGSVCGLLAVGSDEAHPGLTAAQAYVLQTHAALIGLVETVAPPPPGEEVAREAKNERLRLLESVAVHANDAILITEAEPIDPPGPRILYCNAAFTRTTGYEENEVLGRTPRMLQGPKSDRATLDLLRESLLAWKPVVVELVNYRKDGSEFWIELSIVPVANTAGWFTHWVSVQRDISDRRAAEEAKTRARIAELSRQALEAEISERKLVEERLFHAAYHDDLTKLPNRAFFMERLSDALARARRSAATGAALLFLDLNRFKFVNDTLGHGFGDRLLVGVADRISHCIRPCDVVARMGGDEFALLVDATEDANAAIAVAGRITDVLAAPFNFEGHDVQCSCSIGLVHLTRAYHEPEELLRDADIAMYRARRAGSGGYAVFTDTTDAEAVRALELQSDIRSALERQEFRVWYQPIFSASSGNVSAFEALVRWQHPKRGLLQPGAFIPLAEEIGLATPLGRWVVQQSARQARRWRDERPSCHFRMNVNVSARELLDDGFISNLLDTLDSCGLTPDCLELEITETVFLDRSRSVLHTLEHLRSLGMRLALDDFGTGYSSLGYLDTYPIDTLKIDRSFVAGVLLQRRARAIVETIIHLAMALEIDTVAEGIETAEQRQALVAMGCRNLQGFHCSRPVEAVEASRFLHRGLV